MDSRGLKTGRGRGRGCCPVIVGLDLDLRSPSLELLVMLLQGYLRLGYVILLDGGFAVWNVVAMERGVAMEGGVGGGSQKRQVTNTEMRRVKRRLPCSW